MVIEKLNKPFLLPSDYQITSGGTIRILFFECSPGYDPRENQKKIQKLVRHRMMIRPQSKNRLWEDTMPHTQHQKSGLIRLMFPGSIQDEPFQHHAKHLLEKDALTRG